MNIVPLLVTDPQPPIAVQPGQGLLDVPAMPPQSLAAFDALPCDPRGDPALAQGLAAELVVVALVRMQLLRSAARSARLPVAHRRDRVHRGFQQFTVVPVGPRQHGGQGGALAVYDEMMLRTLLAPVRRVRAHRCRPDRHAPFGACGAGTLAESKLARDQSIWSASARRSSSTACSSS